MTNNNGEEMKRLLTEMDAVLRLLMNWKKCYHYTIEKYFKVNPSANKPDCGSVCSACNGEVKKYTGLLYQPQLMSVLATNVKSSNPLTPAAFMKLLKANKINIFHADHIPKTSTVRYHMLARQMVANDIIHLEMINNSKVGTNKITNNDFHITLPNTKYADGLSFSAYMISSSDNYMTTIENNAGQDVI